MNLISIAYAASEGSEKTGFATFFSAAPWWILAFLVFIASFFIAALISKIVVNRVSSRAKYDIHEEVLLLTSRAVYFGIVILGSIIAFSIVDINISSIIGFLGLGIGFAFKDLLSNVIAGVVILTQKKFKIGDLIKIGDKFGKIVEIDVRTTQVKQFDGIVIIIPNAKMLTDIIQNYTANPYRRITIDLRVHYSTNLEEVKSITMKSLEKIEEITPNPAPEVLALEFGESSVDLEVRFWLDSSIRWWGVQASVIHNIKKDFAEAGIVIPFPIRTLSIDKFDPAIKEIIEKK